eukprot:m.70472 g.70472  ORF g.70472 m.70472 type:complete len:395 (-) comp24232_c0_seq1:205-1389(-)
MCGNMATLDTTKLGKGLASKCVVGVTSVTYDEALYKKGGYGKSNPVTNLGTGDSKVYFDVVPELLAADAFTKVREEVKWSEMLHKGGAVPRLVCMQGEFIRDENDKIIAEPVYRHPADMQPPMLPWSPVVATLRDQVSKTIGQPINHALIQWYRDGNDHISSHADKTLDIERGSDITNLSLGATRLMILRDKKGCKTETDLPPRPSQRVSLVNGSLFSLGWQTNLGMTHEIRQDKRAKNIKLPSELLFDGHRISITFRHVSTFQRHSDKKLYGQGAKFKTEKELDDHLANTKTNTQVDVDVDADRTTLGPAPAVTPVLQVAPPPVLSWSDVAKKGAATNPVAVKPKATDKAQEELEAEAVRMVHMFGEENRSPKFDWDKCYGQGFNVMNMQSMN